MEKRGPIVLAAVALLALACTGGGRAGGPADASPVVLVAVDGFEWDVVIPLLKAGQLPNLARLMERGRYGELLTLEPTWSPVIWTTVATGKPPQAHGIHHFVRREPGGGRSLYTSRDRRTKALWNIVSDDERTVNVIGWWMTWPVEPIVGVLVAQTNTTAQLDTKGGRNVWKGTLRDGVPEQVYPAAREAEMLAVLGRVETDLPRLTRRIFGEFPHPLSVLGGRLWNNCRWAFRADAVYLEIALALAGEEPPADLTMLYFGGPDVVGHRFWRYRQPGLYRDPPAREEVENFGRVIDDYYVYVDRALGRLVAAHGPEATFLVVSDHGMRPVNRESRFDADRPPADVNSAEHQDAPPGVLIAAGPAIERGRPFPLAELARQDLEPLGNVFDLAPTVLAMLRIPLGEDLEGRVLEELFRPEIRIAEQPPAVPTHDTPEFLASRQGERPRSPGEAERLEQLKSLGYID